MMFEHYSFFRTKSKSLGRGTQAKEEKETECYVWPKLHKFKQKTNTKRENTQINKKNEELSEEEDNPEAKELGSSDKKETLQQIVKRYEQQQKEKILMRFRHMKIVITSL